MDSFPEFMKLLAQGGPLAITGVIAYFYWKAEQERKQFLKIILEVIPKTTSSLNRLRHVIAGRGTGDEEDDEG